MTTIVVHSGTFHADDLFATATVKKMLLARGVGLGGVKIIRTRSEEEIESGDYVMDVGGIYDPSLNRFDHHQEGGAGERENGIPYAAFGLVWKKFGTEVAGSAEAARAIDERLVQTIDALDNGVDIFGELVTEIPNRYLLQSALGSFIPTWKENDRTMNEAFMEALEFVEKILEREVLQEKDRIEALIKVEEEYVNSEVEDERILLLSGDYSHYRFTEDNPQILFVIKPDQENGNWKVRAVQASPQSFVSRKPLPAQWAGKSDAELVAVSGVEDALFVHNKRFIAVAKSKEGALELAQKALQD